MSENVIIEEQNVKKYLTIMEDKIPSQKVQNSRACMTNDINHTKRKIYKMLGRLLLRNNPSRSS